MTTPKASKIYFPNLDGLRFIAFLVVFISHCTHYLGYQNDSTFYRAIKKLFLFQGDLGVNFFFVLSGFLITYLLLKEKDSTGTISLRNFYMRRILRIWPVYFITLIIGFFIIPFFIARTGVHVPFTTDTSPGRILWYLFFGANIDLAFHYLPKYAPSAIVAVLWSVSVEEQFYLIWPLVVKITKRKTFSWFIIIVILASLGFRYIVSDHFGLRLYFTFSVMSDLAVGAGLAYGAIYMAGVQNKFANMSRFSIAGAYILLLLFIPFKGALRDLFTGILYNIINAVLPLIFSCLFAFVIAEQNYSENSLLKIGKHKKMTSFGKISYGLYSYHMIAMFVIVVLAEQFVVVPYTSPLLFVIVAILAFLIALLFGFLSFRYIESIFLSFKKKFSH